MCARPQGRLQPFTRRPIPAQTGIDDQPDHALCGALGGALGVVWLIITLSGGAYGVARGEALRAVTLALIAQRCAGPRRVWRLRGTHCRTHR